MRRTKRANIEEGIYIDSSPEDVWRMRSMKRANIEEGT
jgi:hypothetical protein